MSSSAPTITDSTGDGTPLTVNAAPPLRAGEHILATLEPDLNASLQFVSCRVMLTTERIISDSDGQGWASWALDPSLTLHHGDHGGVATLALHDASKMLARWRFTLEQEVGALRFIQNFEKLQAARARGQAISITIT